MRICSSRSSGNELTEFRGINLSSRCVVVVVVVRFTLGLVLFFEFSSARRFVSLGYNELAYTVSRRRESVKGFAIYSKRRIDLSLVSSRIVRELPSRSLAQRRIRFHTPDISARSEEGKWSPCVYLLASIRREVRRLRTSQRSVVRSKQSLCRIVRE